MEQGLAKGSPEQAQSHRDGMPDLVLEFTEDREQIREQAKRVTWKRGIDAGNENSVHQTCVCLGGSNEWSPAYTFPSPWGLVKVYCWVQLLVSCSGLGYQDQQFAKMSLVVQDRVQLYHQVGHSKNKEPREVAEGLGRGPEQPCLYFLQLNGNSKKQGGSLRRSSLRSWHFLGTEGQSTADLYVNTPEFQTE